MALLTLLLCASCGGKPEPGPATSQIGVAGHTVTVETALTPEQHRRGLMGRQSLPPDYGMLFVYPTEQYVAFWMKGTPIPLSVAFIRASGHIIQVAAMAPNTTTTHPSQAPVKYALEMPAGWFREHRVKPGDYVEIPQEISGGR